MNGFLSALKTMPPARLMVLMISLFATVAIATVFFQRITAPKMTLLYGGLSASEASEIATALDSLAAPYEVRGEGSLYVPDNRVGELRLKVAGQGLVGNSTTGYEVFDKGSMFGTTSMVQNINARRALEGELAKTITSLPSVQSARVHLVMPEKKLFAKNKTEPSAAVYINLGGRILAEDQVQSIVQLVAAAVPQLQSKHITVIDQRGSLLSTGKASDNTAMATSNNRMRQQIESNYEGQIIQMLERITGPGNVRATVTAEMDFDMVEEMTEEYDPNSQVARSEQRSETSASANQKEASDLAEGEDVEETTKIGNNSTENRAEETINYEISKTVTKSVKGAGAVTRLSVAVLLANKPNDAGAEDENSATGGYSPAELRKIEALVKTAIGYNEDREDSVEVVAMPFQEIEVPEVEAPPMFVKEDYFRIGEYVLGFVALLIFIFGVLKPLSKLGGGNISHQPAPANANSQQQRNISENSGQNAPTSEDLTNAAAEQAISESMIDMAKVQGKVRESTVKQMTEIVDSYPEESLSAIRAWMADGNGRPSEE